jgi:hypothetical protein
MADTKISDMTDLTTLADGDELPVADASDLTANKSFTLATLRGFLQGINGPVIGGLPLIKTLASDATENETASMAEVTGLTYSSQPAGRWLFEYNLIVQTADVANSFKFAVDHSGTASSFMYWMLVMGNSATAAVGAWDQEVNATTGFVISSFATRLKNTTLGPGTGVDTANADVLVKLVGMYETVTTGNLKLMHGSALTQANGTTVKAGSSLVLLVNATNF